MVSEVFIVYVIFGYGSLNLFLNIVNKLILFCILKFDFVVSLLIVVIVVVISEVILGYVMLLLCFRSEIMMLWGFLL